MNSVASTNDHTSSVPAASAPSTSPNLEWFKHYWYVFHMAALMAPPQPTQEDHERMRNFYIVFGQSIPCETECQPDYFRIINTVYPFRYANDNDLFEWTVDVHNEVNRKLGKYPVTYYQAKDAILNPKPPSSSSSSPLPRPPVTSKTTTLDGSGVLSPGLDTSMRDRPDASSTSRFPRWLGLLIGAIIVVIAIGLFMRGRKRDESGAHVVSTSQTSVPTTPQIMN